MAPPPLTVAHGAHTSQESKTLNKTIHLILLTCILALVHTGCAQQCAQLNQNYEQVLSQEAQLGTAEASSLSAGAPTHVGVALRFDLVRDVARTLLVKTLGEKLDLQSNINIGSGKNIPVELSGDALNIGFEADAACETCFRITGDLGGDASVTIPLIGKKRIPLKGAFNFIAPIQFDASQGNLVTVRLDPSKLQEYSQSFLTLELDGLPEAIGRALKQPLTKELLSRLTSRLKPMDLFQFKAPEFGIKGIKLFPSELKLLPKQKAIFLGFTSNLPGIANGNGLSADQAIAFSEKENLAVAIQPRIIKGLITVLMQQDVIPRRYTMQGKSSASGPAHVTLNDIQLVAPSSASAAASSSSSASDEPLNVNFRAWNLFGQGASTQGAGGPCFWFDALVQGLVSLQDRKLTVNLQSIKITNASIAPELIQGITNWKGADFLDKTRQLIETTLSEPQITVPGGGTLTLAPSSLGRDQNTLALRSLVTFKSP